MEVMADTCPQLRDALECLSKLSLRDEATERLERRQGHHHLWLVVIILIDLDTHHLWLVIINLRYLKTHHLWLVVITLVDLKTRQSISGAIASAMT